MKLDVVKQFSTRTERVKGIDFHPTEPWTLTTLYNGKVEIWSYATNTLIRSIQVTELPVRTGRFIARKNWIVVGSDDFQVRVYNYNTGEKVVQFEAHPDYIRCIAVHPTKPYILTCSDDLTIKLWNWEQSWKLEQVFEGHQLYIMWVTFNPKDPNTFASCCLDRTVKVWSLGSSQPNYTLITHDTKGVNYVDYYPQTDKPYLITASDDRTIKVWDYQTKSCVATLEGHTSNVSFAVFHTELPLIISGSEDGTIKFWNSNTFKFEKSINYGLERVWCVAAMEKSNLIGVGCDAGFVLFKSGNEEPLFSYDSNSKLIVAKNSEIFQSIIKPNASEGLADGEIMNLQQRELGSIEVYPQSLKHSPNGRYVAVCGDGEYVVYTALAWRSKFYGKASEFCWNSHDFSNNCVFAIRESSVSVKIFKNFEEHIKIDLIYQADKIFAGALLGIKSEGCISFYDWEHGKLVRRVDLDDDIQDVIWSASGALFCILTNSSSTVSGGSRANSANETYFLTYDNEIYEDAYSSNTLDPEEGCEAAFDVLYTLPTSEAILSGLFIGDVFIYTTSSTSRLNYFVGGEVINLGHFDHKYYIVGYKAQEGKLYLTDKSFNVISWYANAEVLELQTLVMRGDLESLGKKEITDDEAGETSLDVSHISLEELPQEYSSLIKTLSKSELNQLSRFFEKLGYLSLAFALTGDFDSKFSISISTNNVQQAYDILLEKQKEYSTGTSAYANKWKQLGDLSFSKWNVQLAQECYWYAEDTATLLLMLSSANDKEGLEKLATKCESNGQFNIAWQAWWLTGNTAKCIDLLSRTGRHSEASFLNLNLQNKVGDIEQLMNGWKSDLEKNGKSRIRDRLIDDLAHIENGGTTQESDTLIELDESEA